MRCLTGNSEYYTTLINAFADILIFDEALIVHEKDDIQLSSGKMSNFYINLKQIALNSIGMSILGRLVYEWIAVSGHHKKIELFHHLAGKELGAVPIIVATAMMIEQNGGSTNCLVIKKTPKDHGVAKWIEGKAKKGDKVLVVDDVLTTGASVINTIKRCQDEELNVIGALVIVNRGNDEELKYIQKETGVSVDYIIHKDELVEYALNQN